MAAKNDKPNIKEAFFGAGASKKIGGQAVIEGVLMRSERNTAVAVLQADGSFGIIDFPSNGKKQPFFVKWPIIRGVVSFIDSLVLGTSALMKSAEIAGETETDGEMSAFEKSLTDRFGEKKIYQAMIYFSVFLACLLSIGLFMVLPVLIGGAFKPLLRNGETENTFALSVVEGVARILIFLGYILLISKYKEIERVFAFHGAEHKTINCFEANEPLTVSNVKKHTRIHKRCGTSFLFIVMIVSMLVFLFVRTSHFGLRLLSRVLLVPLIAGFSYELLKLSGNGRSVFLYALCCPGLYLQRFTTKEPDDGQIQTAINALRRVIELDGANGEGKHKKRRRQKTFKGRRAALKKKISERRRGHLPFGREFNEKRALSGPRPAGVRKMGTNCKKSTVVPMVEPKSRGPHGC